MEITLKELEMKLINEGKTGYVVVNICESMANRHMRIGYFKDIAEWFNISYENTKVNFIKYVGWNK